MTSSLSSTKASSHIEPIQLSRDLNTTLFEKTNLLEKAKLEFYIEGNEEKHVNSLQLFLNSYKLEIEKLRFEMKLSHTR